MTAASPFDTLDALLRRYELEPGPCPTPFPGGAVGYLSYDLCNLIEKLPRTAADDLSLLECCMALYDLAVTFDHLENRAYIASTGFPEQDEEKRLARAHRRLKETRERLLDPHGPPLRSRPSPADPASWGSQGGPGITLRSNFSRGDYLRAVEAAREYIARGDIFQVNLSQRFDADLPLPPSELYQRLKGINPAPFAAYLNHDDVTVVCASPERFLKVNGGLVETRPMKGTRPRGNDAASDAAARAEMDIYLPLS